MFAVAWISQTCGACSDFMWQWTVDDWRLKPQSIYHGKVVAIRAPRDYAHDEETDPLRDTLVFRSLSRSIDVKVFETLKGRTKSFIRATLQPCEGGLPNYLNEVILFRVGSVWHAKTLVGEDPNGDPIATDVYRSLTTRHEP